MIYGAGNNNFPLKLIFFRREKTSLYGTPISLPKIADLPISFQDNITCMVHGLLNTGLLVLVPRVKVILWSLSKVTQNETGSQVSNTGPMVLWFSLTGHFTDTMECFQEHAALQEWYLAFNRAELDKTNLLHPYMLAFLLIKEISILNPKLNLQLLFWFFW